MEVNLEETKNQWIEKGRNSALFEVAKNMASQGYSIEQISQVTGFSIADIRQILD